MIRLLFLFLPGVCCSAFLFAQPGATASQNVQTTFFLQTELDRGFVLCPAGNGNLYIAGMRTPDMVLMEATPEGEIVSCNYIDVGISGLDAAVQMIVDSEGKLLVAGNLSEDLPDNGYVFRYDPALRKTLWAKTFGGEKTVLTGILELGPGGNFLVYANPHYPNSDDAEFMALDRNTGNIAPGSAWRYHLGSSDQFAAITLHDGALYATGRFTNGVSFDFMRPALLKIDLATGSPLWTQLGHVGPAASARLYGRDMVLENGAIISTFSGNDNGADLGTSNIFLQKTSLDGVAQWVKKISLPGWNATFAEEIVSVAGGYVLFARTRPGEERVLFMIKTDKDGNLLWARKIKQDAGTKIIGAARGRLLVQGDYVFATGYSENPAGEGRMFLLKVNADGQISDSCAAFLPAPATISTVLDPVFFSAAPAVAPSPTVVFDLPVAPPVHFIPERQFVCLQVDDGDCQDMPDITFQIDSIRCGGGKVQIFYTQCNLGGAPVGSFLVQFYAGNPTQTAADRLSGLLLLNNTPLAPDACRSGMLSYSGDTWLPADGAGGQYEIFSVANHTQNWEPPFSLDSFPSTALLECNYANNLSSTIFDANSPPLELGPDIVLCDGNSATLDAGPAFYSYLWNTGATSQTLFVADPGTYWVEVTDDCGIKQRDSLFFTFSLLPDTRFPDTLICPGESFVYAAPGFDSYAWAPAAGLSCTDCPSVTIQPTTTTLYTLFASTADGCVLQDTFLVEVLAGQTTLTIECPSDITVVAAPDASAATVFYGAPSISSDCPCGDLAWTLAQGLPSGADFPLGQTPVCLEATDGCLADASCCFRVTVEQPPVDGPCDVKETPCVRFEILGIFQNPARQKIYRMRVVNKCPNELVYVAYQLPGGLPADLPANNSVYTAPSGRQYEVRNPNASPFPSIRFKALGTGIAAGEPDIFEYTLAPQAAPLFIQATVRLLPQVFYETHLNVFDCVVQQIPNRPDGRSRETAAARRQPDDGLRVFPNPASDRLVVDLSAWQGQPLQLTLQDMLGQVIFHRQITAEETLLTLELPAHWPQGWYVLTAVPADGQRRQARFIRTE